MKGQKRILIRGVNWIGDSVLTLPAIASIRASSPDAFIALLVKPWVADIFKGNPYIDEIIPYDEDAEGLPGKLRLAREIRKKKFDVAFLLQNAFDAALIAWLAGIPERIGYSRDMRRLLLTKPLPVSREILSRHQVFYYLNIAQSAGCTPSDAQPYLMLTDDERLRARDLINKYFPDRRTPLIGINPGAAYGSAKRWPSERFGALISRIIDSSQERVVVFGSESEVEIANEILSSVRAPSGRILNMAGKTDLRELAALIAECDVFVTNDSGPMHMASALHVPIVAIFGSTNRKTTGPFGEGHIIIASDIECSPCMERECPEGHLRCMSEITADAVFSAVRELLPDRRAIFLDKDGTLIEDKNYLNSFDDLVLLPGVRESLQRLKKAGFMLIGITNQSGITRGIVEESFVNDSNAYLQKKLGIDDFYYCPHHPDDRCACRKPEPVLLLRARLKYRLDIRASYVIGDKESDVLLGCRAGATSILLSPDGSVDSSAAHVAKDIQAASEWILQREKHTYRING